MWLMSQYYWDRLLVHKVQFVNDFLNKQPTFLTAVSLVIISLNCFEHKKTEKMRKEGSRYPILFKLIRRKVKIYL